MRALLLLATLTAVAGFATISWKRTSGSDFKLRFDFGLVTEDLQLDAASMATSAGFKIYMGNATFYSDAAGTTQIGEPVEVVAEIKSVPEGGWYFEAVAEVDYTLTGDTYVNFLGSCTGDACAAGSLCDGADIKPTGASYFIMFVDTNNPYHKLSLWAFINEVDDYSPIAFGFPEFTWDPTDVLQYVWLAAISGQGRTLNYTYAPTAESGLALEIGITGAELSATGNFTLATTCTGKDFAFSVRIADGSGSGSAFAAKSWTDAAYQLYTDDQCQVVAYGAAPVVVKDLADCTAQSPLKTVPTDCVDPLPIWNFRVGVSSTYSVVAQQRRPSAGGATYDVVIEASTLPDGAVLTGTPSAFSIYTFTWTPNATDRNQYVCFVADQGDGGTLSNGGFCALLNIFNVPIGSTSVEVDSTGANLPAGEDIIVTAAPNETIAALPNGQAYIVAFQLFRQSATEQISDFLPNNGSIFVNFTNAQFSEAQAIAVYRWDETTSKYVNTADDCAGHAVVVANVFYAAHTWKVQICHTSTYVVANATNTTANTTEDDSDDKDSKDSKESKPAKVGKPSKNAKGLEPNKAPKGDTKADPKGAKDAKADPKAAPVAKDAKVGKKAQAAIGAGVGAAVLLTGVAGLVYRRNKANKSKKPKPAGPERRTVAEINI